MAGYAWKVACDVNIFLEEHPLCFPAFIAKSLGYTRAEVELALWYWRENDTARKRNDGRWWWSREPLGKV